MIKRLALAVVAALVIMGLFWLFASWDKAQAYTLEDHVFGDSIACGTGAALRVPTTCRVGQSSCWVLHHVTNKPYRYVAVSAGINDAPGPCVRAILRRIVAQRIVVILPAPINSARANVEVAAVQYGAYPISYACKGGCSKRNFHPDSYSALARGVRGLWLTH